MPDADERSIGTPYNIPTNGDWLRHDLSILRDHHGLDLNRGVGKSLSMLAARLDDQEQRRGVVQRVHT